MSLLVKANPNGAEIVRVTPQSAGWKYVGFAAYRLEAGEEVAPKTSASDEICIVVLSGTVSVTSEGGRRGARSADARASSSSARPTPSIFPAATASAFVRTREARSASPARRETAARPRA